MNVQHKEIYAEPLLVKHEPLRDITAGNGKYREKEYKEKAGIEKYTDVPVS